MWASKILKRVLCGKPSTDKALAHVPRSKIRDQLVEVGFDDTRQEEVVCGLSGGWKMKLELARAMLYNADLLLLDEVRLHLPLYTRADRSTRLQPTNHVCSISVFIVSHESF